VCRGAHSKGQPILLKGITGDTVNAEGADVAFPVTTIEGKRYVIFMRNQTLVVDKETETLLRVAVLLKAGFDVKFVTGTQKDPTFGGYLVTPNFQKIRMIFGDNLWRLPMWSDPVRYINDETSPVNRNTLALVPPAVALEALAQPSLPDQEAMQLVHDMWCHKIFKKVVECKSCLSLEKHRWVACVSVLRSLTRPAAGAQATCPPSPASGGPSSPAPGPSTPRSHRCR